MTDIVTGFVSEAVRLFLHIDDGPAVANVVAGPPRPGPLGTLTVRYGFALTLPETARIGSGRALSIRTEDGRDILGSPVRLCAPVNGVIDKVHHNLIGGYVQGELEGEDLPRVVAIVGGETVAVATLRPDNIDPGPGRYRFALLVPASVAIGCHRVVHIAVMGADRYLAGSPVVLPHPAIPSIKFREQQRTVTLAIKISAPNADVAHEWGDYHFARQLGTALQDRGWVTRVDCQDEWPRRGDEAVLVLRGRNRYVVDQSAVNMMWQISHPDRMSEAELADYDHVFVASDIHSRALGARTVTPVSLLHQATDPQVFRPPLTPSTPVHPVLFVGNSRRQYRTFVRWCVEADVDVAVYGSLWQDLIPDRLVRGYYIPNDELHRWYGSAHILLNDHWDTMREFGFLSNRLFDGAASGAFIISDPVRGLSEVFGDTIETASSSQELRQKIDFYLSRPAERKVKAEAAQYIVRKNHTFAHRADTVIETFNAIRARKVLG